MKTKKMKYVNELIIAATTAPFNKPSKRHQILFTFSTSIKR